MISFTSEAYSEIPLPPEVSFEEALERLDPVENSFYILSLDRDSFIQCGGGPSACTVEIRMAKAGGKHRKYVIGRPDGSMVPVQIRMGRGGPWVGQREVLTSSDAVRLFKCFLAGEDLPPEYALRDPTVERVEAPPDDAARAAAAAAPVLDEDETPSLRWLSATDSGNRFGIGGYDCAAFVASRVSVTSDPDIARSFVERRTSTGAEIDGLLPDDAVAMDCTLNYAMSGTLASGAVFRAEEMEDKWDVYRHGERLAFCRSWTGSLVFVAELALDRENLTIRRLWAGAEQLSTGSALALRQFDYLMRSHVLGRTAAHPLPGDLPDDPPTIGQYSFSLYGRNCSFASFEDTIAAPDFAFGAQAAG
jgi:hypothetical protein